MKITIGFPTYDDYSGMELSLQTLALYHALGPIGEIEILVGDNHPTLDKNGNPSEETRKLMAYCAAIGARYIAIPEPVGTAAPRDRLMAEATGDIRIIADGHVAFAPTLLPAVREYFADPAHAKDILTGPILAKRRHPLGVLVPLATHYADVWRSEMWGIWSQAWQCGCGNNYWHFDVSRGENGTCEYHRVAMGRDVATECPSCGRVLPTGIPHAKHEATLEQYGYRRRCWDRDDTEPFEIPGLGLGFFACMKDAWPGFAEGMMGFGGGELHMHELFRHNGGRAVCHPLASWWHRFEREKVPYPLQLWHKVRNYVLWRKRLQSLGVPGMELNPVYDHFVAADGAKINDAQWNWLLENPLENTKWPGHLATGKASGKAKDEKDAMQLVDVKTGGLRAIGIAYQESLKRKERYTPHLETVHELAKQCGGNVVTLGKRDGWDYAVLAAEPYGYTTFNRVYLNSRYEKSVSMLKSMATNSHLSVEMIDPIKADVPEGLKGLIDLLIIDTEHTAQRLWDELTRWAPYCRRWIAVYGTESYGEWADGRKQPGLLVAAREFCEKNPQWKRVFHDRRTSGLSVFSCDPTERTIDRGPGTELAKMLHAIGINPRPDCPCKTMMRRMDAWGPAGCREHKDEIVASLEKTKEKYGWTDWLTAARKSFTTGLWKRVKWTDPFPDMVDEAILLTEADDAAWEAKQRELSHATEKAGA